MLAHRQLQQASKAGASRSAFKQAPLRQAVRVRVSTEEAKTAESAPPAVDFTPNTQAGG